MKAIFLRNYSNSSSEHSYYREVIIPNNFTTGMLEWFTGFSPDTRRNYLKEDHPSLKLQSSILSRNFIKGYSTLIIPGGRAEELYSEIVRKTIITVSNF